MKVNKKILIITIISVFALILIVGIFIINFKKIKIGDYQKYSMYISIDSLKGDKTENYLLDTKYDGKIMNIKTNFFDPLIYYRDFELAYKEKETIYTFNTDSSFINIYSLLKKYEDIERISKTKNSSTFKVNYNNNTIKKILENLYINDYENQESEIILEIVDKKIQKFNLSIKKLRDYDEIKIEITYNEMNNDFKINDSILNNNDNIIEDGDAIIDPSFGFNNKEPKEVTLKENILNIIK